MAIDKKLTELPVASAIDGSDVSIIARNGADYQFNLSSLLPYLQGNIQAGAQVLFGTVLPQDAAGRNGDIFINTVANNILQKVNGTWISKYQLTQGNGSQIYFDLGNPSPGFGNDGDIYINTGAGVFYKKNNNNWIQAFSMLSGPAGPRGPKGDDGLPGADGKSILSGPLDPSNLSTGTNGDFYLNTTSTTLFGPKTNEDWGQGVSLSGITADDIGQGFLIDSSEKLIPDYNYIAKQADLAKLTNALVPHPTYTAPTASISSSQAGNYEIGQSVAITINLLFTQNDGGAAQTYSIRKNGTEISTGTTLTDPITITATSPSYQGFVSYAQGPVKQNIIQIDDPIGRINAGTATSGILSNFKGYYKIFYGPVATAPANSGAVRTLTGTLTSTGNTYTLNTGTDQKTFAFWIPTGKTLVSVIDQDALGANITSSYIASALQVTDASLTTLVNGTLYVVSIATAYSSNHRHLITIS
ncbi:collagen-like protein [Mucilaginibacter sp. RS28]|uniref:Collagen-like protein n=1 Tax=Mucilaginibacter straminoryzae TaxID=2932774 RepID=A0A9X1X118_9SPHI|nr:collagen-like protein [Mucilaginibacter straminoryzae]MCJ8208656.1 collagen-like protein [Mucilaginibacter straminoryzae]